MFLFLLIQVVFSPSQGWRSRVSEESQVSSCQTDPQVNAGKEQNASRSLFFVGSTLTFHSYGAVNVLQGVTLTDLKEAQRTNNLPTQDRQTKDGDTVNEWCCVRKALTDDRVCVETTDFSPNWRKTDEVSERDLCRDHFRLTAETAGGCFRRKFCFPP